jgi:hypothetical protein
MFSANRIHASWDLSENRRNSFSPADEAALRQIKQPLRVTVFLAAEDPRLNDLEQNVLRKLRRSLGRLEVNYTAAGRTGLFSADDEHYGEVIYEMNGQTITERSIIEEVILEQIYHLAGVAAPERKDENVFAGYPLATQPRYAAGIFYGIWPVLVVIAWFSTRRFGF